MTSLFKVVCVVCLMYVSLAQATTLRMIGDSTMANKANPKTNPECGWGQVLQTYFDANKVTVVNYALNGRSSKSFIGEGHWAQVLDDLQPGDYLFIQFGHNDEKVKSPDRYTNPYTGYRADLVKYVKESRSKGAIPVLLTPIVRRNFNQYGTLVDTHGAYPLIVRDVARDLKVPFIDMQWKSEQLVTSLGVEKSKQIYLWPKPGQTKRFPKGRQDNTHFCKHGAMVMAGLAVQGIKEDGLTDLVKGLNRELSVW